VETKGFSQPVDKNAAYKKEKKVGNTLPFNFNVYRATETKDTGIVDDI
jgi:hypothetical protein